MRSIRISSSCRDAGIEGVLLLGTTGEGILLSVSERKRAVSNAVDGPLPVLAHCGAQTTADTVALAAHAAEAGAEAVAVIAPPYFQSRRATSCSRTSSPPRAHARRCRSTSTSSRRPRATRSRVAVVERLRETADNLVGMKVSDAPFAKVEPYLLEGLDVFIGAESLIGEGLAAGAAGAVSGLAAAFPEVVVEAVAERRLDEGRRAAGDHRPLSAPRGVEGGRPLARRADPRGRARAAARPDRRRAHRAARRALGGLVAQLVDRVARALVHVGAPVVDVRGLRCRLRLGLRLLRRGELRPQLVGGRRAETARASSAAAGAPAAPVHRPGARARRFTAAMLHCRRFSPRPSRRHPKRRSGGGADSVHEKGEFGTCERIRNHAAAGPGARRRARERDHPAHSRLRRGSGRHLGRPRAVGSPAARLRDQPQGRRRSTTSCSSRAPPRRSRRSCAS